MRKYMLVVLIFILSACSLGQRQAKRSAPAPTSAPVSVSTVAAVAPTNPLAATATAESNPTSTQPPNPSGGQPSTSLLSPPPIPQNGAYLGAFVHPISSGGDFVSQLPQFQSDLGGKRPGILSFFADFLDPVPTTDLQAIEATGSIPEIDWGGNGSCPSDYISGIVSGQDDQQIMQYADGLKSFGHPVFLRWYWEMNLTDDQTKNCLGSAGAAGYIAAWKHIYTLFHQAGATNVAFVWCPGGPLAVASMDPFFPGADYVDWIGVDGFLTGNNASSFAGLYMHWYTAYVKYGKPLIVAETGASPNDQAEFLNGIGQTVPTQFPNLKAIVYFDSKGPQGEWELTQAGLSAFAQLLASPYFSFHQ